MKHRIIIMFMRKIDVAKSISIVEQCEPHSVSIENIDAYAIEVGSNKVDNLLSLAYLIGKEAIDVDYFKIMP